MRMAANPAHYVPPEYGRLTACGLPTDGHERGGRVLHLCSDMAIVTCLRCRATQRFRAAVVEAALHEMNV
jgi:hypothetical protein